MSRLKAFKNYFIKHSEQVFALLIIVSVAAINYLIPYKLVFLNFFFIVILLGAYYLEGTQGDFGWCPHHLACHRLCLLLSSSFMAATTERDLWLNILAWSSFLILTGSRSWTIDPPFENGGAATQKLKRDMQAENAKLEEWVAKLVR